MRPGHVGVAPQPLHLVVQEPGGAAGSGEQQVHRPDRGARRIGLVGPPHGQLGRRGQLAGAAARGDLAPVLGQGGLGRADHVGGLGQPHIGRGGLAHLGAGIGPDPAGGLVGVDVQEPPRDPDRHGREAEGEVGDKGRAVDAAVVQAIALGRAGVHADHRVDPVLGHEDLLQLQGLGPRARQARHVPVVEDRIVLARHDGVEGQHHPAQLRHGLAEAEAGPLRVVAAAGPAEPAGQDHPAVDRLALVDRRHRRRQQGFGISPDLVLHRLGHQRQAMAVLGQQTRHPGGGSAGPGDVDDQRAVLFGAQLQPAIGQGLQGAGEARLPQQPDVLLRDLALGLGLAGVGRQGRQQGADAVLQRLATADLLGDRGDMDVGHLIAAEGSVSHGCSSWSAGAPALV